MGEQPEVLEHHARSSGAAGAAAPGVGRSDVLAVEVDLAERGLDPAGQAAHEGGLAAARRAHDHEDLARL